MDYNPLLDAAKKKAGMKTDYQLAKALGYKNISTIYQVRKGARGLRPERLMQLLKLAGKTLAGAATISAALLASGMGTTEAQAGQTPTTVYYVKSHGGC